MGLYNRLLAVYYNIWIVVFTQWLLLKQWIFDRHISYDASGVKCAGKVAIVTGGSRGIGLSVAKRLAQLGLHVIIASRNDKNGAAAVETIKKQYPAAKVEYQSLDLISTTSIRQFAENFLKRDIPLHYLINNAGATYPELSFNADGVESTLMTNYVGGFLLCHLLLPLLQKTGTPDSHARIVNVASEVHKILPSGSKKTDIDWKNLDGRKFYHYLYFYGVSKAFQVMHGYKLQRMFHEKHLPVNAISVHPGVVNTDMMLDQFDNPGPWTRYLLETLIWSPDQAADNIIFAALKPELDSRGVLYLVNCQESESKRRLTYMAHLQDRLWKETCGMLGMEVDPDMIKWIGEVERVEKLFGVYEKEE